MCDTYEQTTVCRRRKSEVQCYLLKVVMYIEISSGQRTEPCGSLKMSSLNSEMVDPILIALNQWLR